MLLEIFPCIQDEHVTVQGFCMSKYGSEAVNCSIGMLAI